MIDQQYLDRFGENRYKQTLSVAQVDDEPLFKNHLDVIDMKFLKELGKSDGWSSIIYDLYYYLEMIQRIDFFSKYYFHSFSPKARNIDSLKLVFVHKTHMFVYKALTDKIYVYNQEYFKGLNAERDYLVIVNDNRQLQKFYGEFSLMLGLLNTGHYLYNLDYVLKGHRIRHRKLTTASLEKARDFVTIPLVLEIALDQEYHLSTVDIKEQPETEFFRRRVSEQNIKGDSVVKKLMLATTHHQFLKEFLVAAQDYPEIGLWTFIDNIADLKSGFYRIGETCEFIQPKEKLMYKKMLQEYQDFTNLEGMYYWIFFTFEKTRQDYDDIFLRIGHFAQHLSIIAAKYGMAARGIKNYNDKIIKEKFNLENNVQLGYSLNLFKSWNTSHSIFLK
ncbi:hypothetical protein ACE1MS_16180 [Lysinibacillus sp. fkY74-1]|uniref:hypothetical protein n=1 Tax=Lysinibacillus TaxID=400634 RepID=UPI0013B07CFD|nr:hypothetical protein [Lysinibacillus sphaericus]MDM5352006.1 hypothetical protein [Lysinibacillus sphaericus]MEB7453986.1 hypothetical protein [Lysinibacillus sphaericus]QIC46811.1 hypothetical protein GAG94_06415 [Lysinibacillus sphaericus]QPA53425.1 hypothetical protein INQ53_16480 [Lysinibacillus sphaericus]QTB25942.1 hypothetical protein J2D51_16770 [Lysinibacillus sphaericus]